MISSSSRSRSSWLSVAVMRRGWLLRGFSLLFVSEARPPFLRVLRAVEHGIDDDAVVRRLIENLIGKPANRRVAELIPGDRESLRMALDREQARLDAAKKILTEAGFAALIPVVGFRNIVVGLRRVDEALNHAASAPAA